MQNVHFEESVASILCRDGRYDGHAYLFLRDALDYTMKRAQEQQTRKNRHVSGRELLEGFRDFALEQYGPMAATLMEEWGVRQCRDVGNMVFLLIEEQVFGRQDSDKPEDFEGHFDMDAELRKPFLPSGVKSERRRVLGTRV
jgi:uncharacterized repeat protein (TIGR04138 family)